MLTKLKIFISILALFITVVNFSSCVDEEGEAQKSVIGSWRVTAIQSLYGQFTSNGHSGLDVKREEGNLGFFDFTDDGTASYNFVRNDTTYQNTTAWTLTSREERNTGFKVTKYTLTLTNDFRFETEFGDGSHNSTVKANQLKFIQWPDKPGYGVGIVIQLEKR